jgi:sigma-B regulation protein RsbU (phosphoserine phosphatase)
VPFAGLKRLTGKLTVLRLFAALTLLLIALWFSGHSGASFTLSALLDLALAVLLLARFTKYIFRHSIWRLRNRLVVTYMFMAVVPIVLILILAGLGSYFVAGQVAVYLVQSELERRTAALAGPAQYLRHAPPAAYPSIAKEFIPFLRGRFPSLEILIAGPQTFRYPTESKLEQPSATWGDFSGLIVKDGAYYSFAHLRESNTDITLLAPVTLDFLSDLIPNLGDVRVLDLGRRDKHAGTAGRNRVPPAASRFDYAFEWFAPLSVANWSTPGATETHVMTITTRPSALLSTVFEKVDVAQVVLIIFIVVCVLFLIVELVALIIGINMTRTITTAVQNLYSGTERISGGDVSHRIAVKGSDQLAELGHSFNSMTANLERLIIVEKEKERLQSEIEIAREVQNQLFPRSAPELKSLELTGICHPARMVSGDYYDYLCVQNTALAFAIGDVAGKGISAALLMASIQSIMRTQLSTGVHAVAATVGGPVRQQLHTSPLVSHLNRQLYESTAPEKYATFFFAIYDEHMRTLTYTNAGHLPPVLLRSGETTLLNPTGTVVGAFPHCVYQEESIMLEPGDVVIAYTDGVTEPENEYGEEFGLDRVIDLVKKNLDKPTREMINEVLRAVAAWTNTPELPDDMTMLIARRV